MNDNNDDKKRSEEEKNNDNNHLLAIDNMLATSIITVFIINDSMNTKIHNKNLIFNQIFFS